MNNSDEMFQKMDEILNRIKNGVEPSFFEDNKKFALEVGNYFDNLQNRRRGKCLEFLAEYFVKYMISKYGKEVNLEVSNKVKTSFFSQVDNTIHISFDSHVGNNFDYLLFAIFHEYRHKLQFSDVFNNNGSLATMDRVAQIDPATILFLKDNVMRITDKTDIYKNNHNCFFEEHDANLFSIQECKKFIDVTHLKKFLTNVDESTDYVGMLVDGDELYSSRFKKVSEELLPIVFEEDYRTKKRFANIKPGNTILSLIFDENGRLKSYEELMQDEKELTLKYSDEVVNNKTSTTGFNEYTTRTPKDHFRELYRIIVHSDPMLTIQKYFHLHNSAKNVLASKKWEEKICELLNNCPQLFDMYFEDLESILVQECSRGNTDIVESIISMSPKMNTTIIKQALTVNKLMQRKPSKFKSIQAKQEEVKQTKSQMTSYVSEEEIEEENEMQL